MLKTMAGLDAIHVAAVSEANIALGNPGTAVTYCIGINSEGKRFVDESKGYQYHGKAVMNQPGAWDALIFDQATVDHDESTKSIFINRFSLFDQLGCPYVVADTIEGLAQEIGVDPAALQRTIDEYNASIDGEMTMGLDVPKAALAFPVSTPPFYAFTPLKPGCTLTFGGIYIDDKAQALESDGKPIRGLYAAGETCGGFFSVDYIAGGSLSRSAVFGVLAAESIDEFLSA